MNTALKVEVSPSLFNKEHVTFSGGWCWEDRPYWGQVAEKCPESSRQASKLMLRTIKEQQNFGSTLRRSVGLSAMPPR